MKTHWVPLALAVIVSLPATLFAQGTAFTYRGRLQHGDNAANGLYELGFALYDAPANGNGVGTPVTIAPVTIAPVTVSNGLFTPSSNPELRPSLHASPLHV